MVLCVWWSYRRLTVPGLDKLFRCSTSLRVSGAIISLPDFIHNFSTGSPMVIVFSVHFLVCCFVRLLAEFQSATFGLPGCCYSVLFDFIHVFFVLGCFIRLLLVYIAFSVRLGIILLSFDCGFIAF